MTSKVIEVDFFKKGEVSDEKSQKPSDRADLETKEEKILRLREAIEKGKYSPNYKDLADSILSEILLDDGANLEE